MEIAIDTSPLNSGHATRGTGSYTKLLISALQKYEKSHTYHLITRGQKVPENADLVHYPYFDPFFLTLPVVKPKPVVVTVHDLIPISFPSHFPRGIRGQIKWEIQKFSLRGAKEIITDSMSSKSDILRLTGADNERVNDIYLAPSEIYKPVRDAKILRNVATKYKLPERYLLYVGDVNWNKNIVGLLRVVKLLEPKLPLVMAGKAFLDGELPEVKQIDNMIRDLKIEDRIIMAGFVPEEELPAIYSLASVCVQPSFAEGFGLPVLEAMACGCPVVASAASSLKEIAGPSVMVDPLKPDKIMEGIRIALSMKRDIWMKESISWLANFSLKKMAVRTVEVYEKALS